jgi:hypothetical protein
MPGIVDDARLRGYMQQIGARLLGAARDVMRDQFSSKAVEESDWKYSKDMQFHMARSGLRMRLPRAGIMFMSCRPRFAEMPERG